MAKRTKLGAAGASILKRRTGADALAVATSTTPKAPARHAAGYKVTTVRLAPDQWQWLRRQALGRSMESGAMADASEIVRELVAAAMTTKGAR